MDEVFPGGGNVEYQTRQERSPRSGDKKSQRLGSISTRKKSGGRKRMRVPGRKTAGGFFWRIGLGGCKNRKRPIPMRVALTVKVEKDWNGVSGRESEGGGGWVEDFLLVGGLDLAKSGFVAKKRSGRRKPSLLRPHSLVGWKWKVALPSGFGLVATGRHVAWQLGQSRGSLTLPRSIRSTIGCSLAQRSIK